MGMLDEAVSIAGLRAGLEQAQRNGGRAGPDGVTLAMFTAAASHELERLRDEVLTGQWRPRPALRMKLPKPGGGHRALAVGCVRDRVVQHALAATLSFHLDDALHRFAWGWRRGRSAAQALAAVDAALAEGRHWVLRGDIEDFFDRIPPQALLAALRDHTHDEALVRAVGHLLGAGVLEGGSLLDPMLGTPQGSPLSPCLANLYLVAFDRAVEAAGFEMVRYGDDLCIPVLSRDDAARAHATVVESLSRLRLQMNASKATIRHLGEGFSFLGWSVHAGGRRAGSKARESLRARIDEARADSPDPDAAVERVLRGWITYYGSLSGVTVPEPYAALAERLVEDRAQSSQLGAAGASHDVARVDIAHPARPSSDIAHPVRPTSDIAPSAPAAANDPWTDAAVLLWSARGSAEESEVLSVFTAKVGLDATASGELADALRRFDGPVAAEVLARAGRYDDAERVAGIRRPSALAPAEAPARRGLPVTPDEVVEPPRFDPAPADHDRLLSLFGGAEHTFLRDVRVGDRIERQRVTVPPTAEHVKSHTEGAFWMGVYPLRANHSVRWGAFRVVQSARVRSGVRGAGVPEVCGDDARRLIAAFTAYGLHPTVSVEPGRAWVLWVFFAEAVTAARARALLARVSHRAGPPGVDVTREIVPLQETAKPDKPGAGMLLPLGRDPRTGERAWLCDETLTPCPDAVAALRAITPVSADALRAVMALPPKSVATAAGTAATAVEAATAASATTTTTTPTATTKTPRAEAPPSRVGAPAQALDVAVETTPFRELPRAQEVYRGCAVVRHMVDQALTGGAVSHGDRLLLADVLARLGDESSAAAEALFRHFDDYKPGMGGRYLQRIYPHPTSCGRIRQRLPELTARVGCDCRFRVPPGAYPTPVLHALGAADVPGLADKVREAASRGGLARAAVEAMNEGRKELGARAAALCARLSDLRRQARVLEKTIAGVESDLDAALDEAGDAALETPSGVLERVHTDEGARRFILRV